MFQCHPHSPVDRTHRAILSHKGKAQQRQAATRQCPRLKTHRTHRFQPPLLPLLCNRGKPRRAYLPTPVVRPGEPPRTVAARARRTGYRAPQPATATGFADPFADGFGGRLRPSQMTRERHNQLKARMRSIHQRRRRRRRLLQVQLQPLGATAHPRLGQRYAKAILKHLPQGLLTHARIRRYISLQKRLCLVRHRTTVPLAATIDKSIRTRCFQSPAIHVELRKTERYPIPSKEAGRRQGRALDPRKPLADLRVGKSLRHDHLPAWGAASVEEGYRSADKPSHASSAIVAEGWSPYYALLSC